MRRYAFDYPPDQIEKHDCDVVIIGSGLAGLYTALNIDESLSCVVLSKEKNNDCNSFLAQGGIAAVCKQDDAFETHYNDTLRAGARLCDKEAVKVLVGEAPEDILKLMSVGVAFDMDEQGHLHVTQEGGHSRKRVVHCGGDATGREVIQKLTEVVAARPNVTIKYDTFFVDVITDKGRTAGVWTYENGHKLYVAPNVVICSGGIGQIYRYTTNPAGATGDGIAAAVRAGVKVRHMEFVQFHPTALFNQKEEERFFLVSEAVRGEGGILRNEKGEQFMKGRHPMGDLAPRDIVAREIMKEIEKSEMPYVYLDITSKSKQYLVDRFPTIYQECEKQGIDMSEQFIPVCPVQHYFMGGIETDLNGSSNIPGLYACGEAACTGVHGANRLASNSLLECLVFGRRCAQHINHQSDWITIKNNVKDIAGTVISDFTPSLEPPAPNDFSQTRQEIKKIMHQYVGINRNAQGIEKGLKRIDSIAEDIESFRFSTHEHVEVWNMAIVARQIMRAAGEREESIGAHYRES